MSCESSFDEVLASPESMVLERSVIKVQKIVRYDSPKLVSSVDATRRLGEDEVPGSLTVSDI